MKTIANHELLGFNDMTYGGGMHGGGHHAPGEEDEEAHLGKKVRHNKVEQNRREMTRKYISELQEMLPNMEDAEPGAGINVVLEGALDYLRSSNGGGGTLEKRRSQAHAGICGSAAAANGGGCRDDEASACQVMAGRACGQINMSSLRFASAFDSAPFGMAVARVDGRILKCNSMFERFLNFLPGALMKETMFSLTAPADLPYTMQVESRKYNIFCFIFFLVSFLIFEFFLNIMNSFTLPSIQFIFLTLRVRPFYGPETSFWTQLSLNRLQLSLNWLKCSHLSVWGDHNGKLEVGRRVRICALTLPRATQNEQR